MSTPYLPAELLNGIVDLLHDALYALRNCCLVSKSWVPRTRKHLFANIRFLSAKRLQSWKKTFPDLSTSPAHYTKSLSIDCPHVFTTTGLEEGCWVRGFSQVVRFEVNSQRMYAHESAVSLVPLHGFSPTLKSLRVTFAVLPSSRVFDLILSFPLLDNLAVIAFDASIDDGDGPNGSPNVAQPSSLPTFTGSLDIFLKGGMESITRRLLSLPSGIHFPQLKLTWNHTQDLSLSTHLVEGCSHTLESLNITSNPLGTFIRHLLSRRQLTSVSSRAGVGLGRPLKGDKTQRRGIPVRKAGRRMGLHDTPNRHTQPPESSKNLTSST